MPERCMVSQMHGLICYAAAVRRAHLTAALSPFRFNGTCLTRCSARCCPRS